MSTPRERAQLAISRAIRAGTLRRPDACEWCGTTTRVCAVPADDLRPLERIQWVCHRCLYVARQERLGNSPSPIRVTRAPDPQPSSGDAVRPQCAAITPKNERCSFRGRYAGVLGLVCGWHRHWTP